MRLWCKFPFAFLERGVDIGVDCGVDDADFEVVAGSGAVVGFIFGIVF